MHGVSGVQQDGDEQVVARRGMPGAAKTAPAGGLRIGNEHGAFGSVQRGRCLGRVLRGAHEGIVGDLLPDKSGIQTLPEQLYGKGGS